MGNHRLTAFVGSSCKIFGIPFLTLKDACESLAVSFEGGNGRTEGSSHWDERGANG